MIQKLIDIFKVRWPEVTLVVVFQVALMLLMERVMLSTGMGMEESTIPDTVLFVLGFGGMLLGVIWQMLYLGFLRTAATGGAIPQEPLALLVAGRPFFWRFLAVQFVMGAAIWAVSMVLAGVAGGMLGYKEAQVVPQWLLDAAGIGAIAIFIKPFFLIPGFMLAMDLSAMEAFAMMRQTRLAELGDLRKGYAAGLGLIAATGVIVSVLAPQDGVVYYVLAGAKHLVHGLTALTLMLATVQVLAEEDESQVTAVEMEETTEG